MARRPRRDAARPALVLAAVLSMLLLGVAGAAGAAQSVRGPVLHAQLVSSAGGHLTLRITLGRRVVMDSRVRSRQCGTSCQAVALPPSHSALRALELGGDHPAVLLGLFSGGAHCCFADELYVLTGATVHRFELALLDDQPTLVGLGAGQAGLRGADARLAESYFTDFAHSGAPFAEWAVTSRGFHSITRRFPGRLAVDARHWWAQSRANPHNNVGYIAAWAADEDQLGHAVLVAHTLAALARAGHLRSSLSGPGHSGRSFVVALQRELRAFGDAPR
jgi:hypothetical protein